MSWEHPTKMQRDPFSQKPRVVIWCPLCRWQTVIGFRDPMPCCPTPGCANHIEEPLTIGIPELA